MVNEDQSSRLLRLKALLDSGAITLEEFEKAKKEILGRKLTAMEKNQTIADPRARLGKPLSRKPIFYVLIAAIMLVVVVGAWFAFVGSSVFGQSQNLLGLEVTLTSTQKTDLYDCPPEDRPGWNIDLDVEAGAGYDLVVANFKLKNTANYPIDVALSYSMIVNSYGTEYLSSSYENNAFYENYCLSKHLEDAYQPYTGSAHSAIPPGTEVEGKEIFRIPENTPGARLIYSIGVTSYYAEGTNIHGVQETLIRELSWNL